MAWRPGICWVSVGLTATTDHAAYAEAAQLDLSGRTDDDLNAPQSAQAGRDLLFLADLVGGVALPYDHHDGSVHVIKTLVPYRPATMSDLTVRSLVNACRSARIYIDSVLGDPYLQTDDSCLTDDMVREVVMSRDDGLSVLTMGTGQLQFRRHAR